uniref:Kinesin-like protein n=1 Tax=Timema monikensis TaxID=170555 RepID=A0A7R9E781_9NEOP|nr:unnamed protein product [Timema monikensis]
MAQMDTSCLMIKPELTNEDNIRVVVRIRPLSEKEIRSRFKNIIRIDHPNHISILNLTHNSDEHPKTFTFDAVLGEASSQEDVYECFGRPVVEKVLEGYNGTIFAYGQTGSGKTYTMEGVQENKDEWGIVPNAIHHIFLTIDQATDKDKSIYFSVRVSYVEVYNDNIHDLLSEDHTASLSIREDPLHGVFVKRLTGFVVVSSTDLYNVTTLGNRNRATGSTKMNEKSSRSHAVLMVTIQQNVSGKLITRVGSLYLVDLAGSERQSKTGTSGVRLKEASKINQSLSTLGKVIAALVDAKSTHVPYRESKLTLLLKNSLGGNSVTTMVANVAPSDYNYDETLCTLRYADRAKHIKNHVQLNDSPRNIAIERTAGEILTLKKELEQLSKIVDDPTIEFIDTDEKERIEEIRRRENMTNDELAAYLEMKIQSEAHETDLLLAKKEYDKVQQMLQQVEKHAVVGEENLLEKFDEQQQQLNAWSLELKEAASTERELEMQLHWLESDMVDIEDKYSSLQEEVDEKTKKLNKLMPVLGRAKKELAALERKQRRQILKEVDKVRDMTRHLDLYDHILSQWIPEDKLLLIEKNMTWDEWTDEWTISHSSLCGNNVQRQQEPSRSLKQDRRGHSDIYRSYSLESSQRKSANMEEKLKLPLIDKKPSTSNSLEE